MTKFNKIYDLILEELTDKQKKLTDKYTAKRNKNLSFGPLFKEERTYFPLNITEIIDIEIPDKIKTTLDNAGFYITDYRAGIAMKKAKLGEQKDLRQIKIGKILQKLNQPNLLKQFNERLGTSKKDIKDLKIEICITYNPYDIAGMSTDRNWTSCMNLNDGIYKDTALKQVQYGGMCAYLINSNDKNIEKPYARIAIKRFISSKDESKFIFLAEKRIYGDEGLAEEVGFQEELIKILEQSNKLTADDSYEYIRKDRNSYSDTYTKQHFYLNSNNLDKISKEQFKKIVLSRQNIPANAVKFFIKKYPELLTQKIIFQILYCTDINKDLIEFFLQHGLCLPTFKYAKDLTFDDIMNILKTYPDIANNNLNTDNITLCFLTNENIKITSLDIGNLLNKYYDKFDMWTLDNFFESYTFDKKILETITEKIMDEYPTLCNVNKFTFLLTQNFPADVLFRCCNFDQLTDVYLYNNKLSKQNKQKIKKYLIDHNINID